MLVSTDWLQDQLNDPSIVILHAGTREVFDSVHIPGARHIDPSEFALTTDSLRNEIPEMRFIEGLLRSVGVNTDSRIVLYYEDEDLISRTARVFMTLDYAGLGDRTSVLNGGLPAWLEEERVVKGVTGMTVVTEGDLKLGDSREVIIGAYELDRQRLNPDFVVIDVRSREEYYGEIDSTGQHATGGHIEGAYFMSYKTVLSDSTPHMFRDDDELQKEFEKVGMDPNKTAVYYCGSGVRASVSYLVSRHLGFPTLLYDGSYQEWEKLDLTLTSPVIDPSDND